MKKLLLSLLILFAVSASAQEATLNSPVARPSATKITIKEINIRQTQVVVSISTQTAAGEETKYSNLVIPDSSPATSTATVVGFITAFDTVRATETGSALRRFQFRVLGYLFDTGYLPGVTLVP